MIKKTFPHTISTPLYRIPICRTMFCIKDDSIIKDIEMSASISEAEFKTVSEACFGKNEYV